MPLIFNLSLCLSIHATEISKSTLRSILQEGLQLFKQEKYREAIPVFTQGIALDPRQLVFYLNRGQSYKYLGENEKAESDFKQVIAGNPIKPNDPAFYSVRGVAHLELENYKQAAVDLQQSLKLDPTDLKTRANLAETYMLLQMFQKAIDHASFVISQRKDFFLFAYNIRAHAYAELGQKQKALEDWIKACEFGDEETCSSARKMLPKNPENLKKRFVRGNVYRKIGDYDLAIADYTQVIQADPQNAPAYLARSESYMAIGKQQEALLDTDKAIVIDPKNDRAYIARADAHAGLKNYLLAEQDLKKSLGINPKSILAHVGLCITYHPLQKHSEGISHCDQAINSQAEQIGELYLMRGLHHEKLNNPEKAILDLNNAIQSGPNHIHIGAIIKLSEIYFYKLKKPHEALTVLNQGISNDPTSPYLLRARCELHVFGYKNYQMALSDCNAAIKLKPDLASAHEILSGIHAHLSHPEDFMTHAIVACNLGSQQACKLDRILELQDVIIKMFAVSGRSKTDLNNLEIVKKAIRELSSQTEESRTPASDTAESPY